MFTFLIHWNIHALLFSHKYYPQAENTVQNYEYIKLEFNKYIIDNTNICKCAQYLKVQAYSTFNTNKEQ